MKFFRWLPTSQEELDDAEKGILSCKLKLNDADGITYLHLNSDQLWLQNVLRRHW